VTHLVIGSTNGANYVESQEAAWGVTRTKLYAGFDGTANNLNKLDLSDLTGPGIQQKIKPRLVILNTSGQSAFFN